MANATVMQLEARLQALEPGSMRYQAVAAAQQFKQSWLALAQHLSHLQRGQAFAKWGYRTFTDYCRQELHLRPNTVAKLTGSYGYLQERAPAVLEASAEAARALPPLDVVDMLRRAKERTHAAPEAWQALEGEVLAGGDGGDSQQLRKRLREVDPQLHLGKGPPAKPEAAQVPVDAHHLRKVLLLAERLEVLLRGMAGGIDAGTLASVEHVAETLRRQVKKMGTVAADAVAGRGGHGGHDGRQPGHLPSAADMQ